MMAVGERQTQRQRRKMPSFSSSLLDAIYHSIDDDEPMEQRRAAEVVSLRRNAAAARVEEEVESLRRAIMVEKWMENYNNAAATRHLPTNSGSSTDSSFFTSSETESSVSASRSTPKSSDFAAKERGGGRFSRAMKIYGDLKKVKEPISPGGRIASFLNSIFSPRNLKKNQSMVEEWGGVRKSRSMKDTTTSSSASRSCLSKNTNPSRGGNAKPKRSVRFCPVNGGGGGGDDHPTTMPSVGSQFLKKNIDSFRLYEVKSGRKHDQSDFDDKSCASSDLFELENIGAYDEELPVYGTTNVKMNRAIASGFNLIM